MNTIKIFPLFCQFENIVNFRKLFTASFKNDLQQYHPTSSSKLILTRTSASEFDERNGNQGLMKDQLNTKSFYIPARSFHVLRYCVVKPQKFQERNGNMRVARKHSSSLFVSDSIAQNTAPIEVDLQIDERVARLGEFKKQLKIRGIVFDVESFVEDYKLLKRLEKEKNTLEQERESVAKQMSELKAKKNTKEIVDARNALINRGKQIKEALKELQMSWWVWEERVVMAALQFPNDLHSLTPEENVKILDTHGEIPDMSDAQCHIEYMRKNDLVKFSSVGLKAYYLKGQSALLEQTLTDTITSTLVQSQFQPLTTSEIFRSIVAEGCGIDYKNKHEIYTLQDKHVPESVSSQLDDFTHIQGVSLMSFVSYLAKTVVQTSQLPYRLFTTGRQYTPDFEGALPGLFGVNQSLKTAVISVTRNSVSCMEEVNKITALLWKIYSKFNLAMRLVLVPGKDLSHSESLRAEIQMWAPGVKQYLKVAHISCIDDYVARRLMCYHSDELTNIKNFQHVHLVYGEVLDITRLIALLTEHTGQQALSFVDDVRLQICAAPTEDIQMAKYFE